MHTTLTKKKSLPQLTASSLTFEKFFPTDTGPLPALGPVKTRQRFWKIEEGLHMLLPSDLEPLQCIKGKFEYVPE